MNLHAIVRGAITQVNPDLTVQIYYAVGQQNIDGLVIPSYDPPETIKAQWQPYSINDLRHVERLSTTELSDQVFLFSDANRPPSGIQRVPLARTGDFIKKGNEWYLITDILEDWTHDGWINVNVELQVKPPEGIGNV